MNTVLGPGMRKACATHDPPQIRTRLLPHPNCRTESGQFASSSSSSKKVLGKSWQQRWQVQALPAAGLQELLVGGAVVSAVGAALYNGLKGDPVLCEGCGGNGGVRCFACQGSGRMDGLPQTARNGGKRDIVGRSIDARACTVCKGSGLILCSRCQGTGYSKRM